MNKDVITSIDLAYKFKLNDTSEEETFLFSNIPYSIVAKAIKYWSSLHNVELTGSDDAIINLITYNIGKYANTDFLLDYILESDERVLNFLIDACKDLAREEFEKEKELDKEVYNFNEAVDNSLDSSLSVGDKVQIHLPDTIWDKKVGVLEELEDDTCVVLVEFNLDEGKKVRQEFNTKEISKISDEKLVEKLPVKRDAKGRFAGIKPSYDSSNNLTDYDRMQVKAYEILKTKHPFAVIYAYSQGAGKGKTLLNPPLIKQSQEEVDAFVNSFKRGNEGVRVVVDVFYDSQLSKIEKSLKTRGLVENLQEDTNHETNIITNYVDNLNANIYNYQIDVEFNPPLVIDIDKDVTSANDVEPKSKTYQIEIEEFPFDLNVIEEDIIDYLMTTNEIDSPEEISNDILNSIDTEDLEMFLGKKYRLDIENYIKDQTLETLEPFISSQRLKEENSQMKPTTKSLKESETTSDLRKEALAKYLNISPEQIIEVNEDNIFAVEEDTAEYLVLTDDEADIATSEDIESLMYDLGASSFTDWYSDWIIENAIIDEEDLIDGIYREELDSQLAELTDEPSDEFENKKIELLYEEGYLSDKDFEEDEDNFQPLKILLIDERELAEIEDQYISDHLADIGIWDVVEVFGGKEEFFDWLKSRDFRDLDLAKIVTQAIKLDSRGHFLASYDGVELELDDDLFGYRIN